jgi:hypothetical protein
MPLWPSAAADRDAELDRVLRELGNQAWERAIPERLLRVLRAAAEAADASNLQDQAERLDRPDEGSG